MRSLIQSIEDWQIKSAKELAELINAKSIEVRDDELYTWAGVAIGAGPAGAEAFRLALEANGMGWAVHQLGGSGMQLSHPLVQQALLGFAQMGVPGCAELAAVGINRVSPWVQAGNTGECTEQDVTIGLFAISKDSLRIAGAAKWNSWNTALDLKQANV